MGLCADDPRVQKGLADLLHSLAGLIRCISVCLLAYTAKVVFTALGKALTYDATRDGLHRNMNNSSTSSSSHACGVDLSRRESNEEKKES